MWMICHIVTEEILPFGFRCGLVLAEDFKVSDSRVMNIILPMIDA